MLSRPCLTLLELLHVGTVMSCQMLFLKSFLVHSPSPVHVLSSVLSILSCTALSWGLPCSVSALGQLRDGGFIEPLWVKVDFRYRAQCYQKEESSELVPDRTRQHRRSRAPQDGVGLGQLIWKKRTGLGFLPSTVPTLT